ncbi:hypothetical protein Tam10B_1275 [Bifidobacterium vansinderenii]|uniref:Uncharacterized protein n=1 Tax=Bifidobacterium vansinderenii TaxID=1984871 RepID=A0A229VXR8_9BIFI|nr:hypothetical protein Tam10B_1275 [Bifidobacterium vansinderenii]
MSLKSRAISVGCYRAGASTEQKRSARTGFRRASLEPTHYLGEKERQEVLASADVVERVLISVPSYIISSGTPFRAIYPIGPDCCAKPRRRYCLVSLSVIHFCMNLLVPGGAWNYRLSISPKSLPVPVFFRDRGLRRLFCRWFSSAPQPSKTASKTARIDPESTPNRPRNGPFHAVLPRFSAFFTFLI